MRQVGSVVFEKCELVGVAGAQRAVGTNEFEALGAGLLLSSVGYRSSPVSLLRRVRLAHMRV